MIENLQSDNIKFNPIDSIKGYKFKEIFIILLVVDILNPLVGYAQQQRESGALIDHAEVIQSLNEKTLRQGKELYDQVCAACHGIDGTASLPQARSFNKDELKYGSDPYSMWKTITNGAGQMGAQRYLTPEQRYAVVQYIREALVREENPGAYFEITESYLEGLPEPSISKAELDEEIKREALSGSQEFGQLYFSEHLGNYGKAIYSSLEERANDVLIVELADNVQLAYNVQRMSTASVWKGSLDVSETKYQLYRGEGEPAVDGHELVGLERMHWSYQDRYDQLVNLVSERTPFPDDWLEYHGHYQHGDNVVLSYSIMGRKVLEMPSAEMLEGVPVIHHTLKIEPGNSWRKLKLGGLGDRRSETVKEGVFSLRNPNAPESLGKENWDNPEESLIVTVPGDETTMKQFFAAGVQGDTEGMRWIVGERHQLGLYIPPSNRTQIIRIHRFSGEGQSQYQAFAQYLAKKQQSSVPDPERYTNGGPQVWDQTIVTQGKLDVGRPHYDPIHYGEEEPTAPENLVSIPDHYPYVVDRIGLPFDNPWNSWIRPSGFDFFEDGRLVMSTYVGDVWLAKGIDEDLDKIRWQRIATGLYDPMGVKIVDGEIYVICRDRIMRLNDLNGDGETDLYETFFADTDVSDFPIQAYNFGLQTDSEGNFYYTKAGQYTDNDDPGNVIRVSPDGKTQESIAIGFRAPNGVTVGPEGRIFVSDNQGNWMPANKINIIEEGGFYGYIPSIKTDQWAPGPAEYQMRPDWVKYPGDGLVLPDTFDQPIIWLPQALDNSPGGGAWTPTDWGPLGDRLVWTSYGKGWAYYVMMQEVDGIIQAAVSALPFQFDSGTQRARINPADGQYYLAGLTGWDDAFAIKYGSLNRIRYTGGESFFMDDVNVRSNGIAITFNQKLDPDVVTKVDRYRIEQWNYRWQEEYGSAHWSVKNPDEKGHDVVSVQAIELSNDRKKVLLKLSNEDLRPVDQMRIQLQLKSEDGEWYKDTIYLTIHKVPGK